jgi:hypothetical protein
VFFAAHPQFTDRARALVAAATSSPIVPWEQLRLPHEVDGSCGSFRVPHHGCTLNATNDYEAVQAWLALHESAATQRAYRKEAGRLLLWAIVERGRALSSLTTDDAIAYRAFLRRPTPRERWAGPPRSRLVQADNPATAEKLRWASPHWMRHSHASHALARGAELTSVRDNLRHASISTTSMYLHTDEIRSIASAAKRSHTCCVRHSILRVAPSSAFALDMRQ